MNSRQSWKGLGLALATLLVLFARPALAQTTINFDDQPSGTPINTQYPGVTFDGSGGTGAHTANDLVMPKSAPNALVVTPFNDPAGGRPMTIKFTQPQKAVSVWACFVEPAASPPVTTLGASLLAFDQNQQPVPGAAQSQTVNAGNCNTQLSVSSPTAVISSVEITMGQGILVVIDDLTFSGGATGTTGGPSVNITSPTDGQIVDLTNNGSLAVTGTVSGQNLGQNVSVTLTAKSAAPSQTPFAANTTLPLDSTGAFSSPTAFTNVPIGIYTLTVTATNTAGPGAQSVTVNNVPSVLGMDPSQFEYSQLANSGECQFVAFNDPTGERATAFFPATQQLISVDREVLGKWQSVSSVPILHGDGTLGCPLTGEVDQVFPAALVGTNANMQEYKVVPFERGTIYRVNKGTQNVVPLTYTARVFSDAINQLSKYSSTGGGGSTPLLAPDPGGINEVGIPVADPTMDLSDDPTFLFQQFARPWYIVRDSQGNPKQNPGTLTVTAGIPNTLEIRGLAPTLYVERVGGSFLDYKASFHANSANCQGVCNVPVPGDVTPTVWESSGCGIDQTTGAYDCAINHPFVQAFTAQTNTPVYSSSPAVPNYGGYCETGNSFWLAVGIASELETEWSAIPGKPSPNDDTNVGDLIDIQELGWVINSNKSSADFPATHEHIQGTADGLEDLGSGQGCVIGLAGCLLGEIGYQLGGHGAGLWSDYDIHVRPIALSGGPDPNAGLVVTPSSASLPPYWNLLAANGDPTLEGTDNAPPIGDIETEWEEFWQHPWVSVAGSTIPIGTLVYANGRWMIDCGHPPQHSEIHPPNTLMFSGMKTNTLLGQNVQTTAQMWVNEFYEGVPYQTQVWPPPRPTATAQMVTVQTTYGFPTAGPMKTNNDGSRTYSFTPSAKKFASLPPETPAIAEATVSEHHDGLLIVVDGPKTNHDVHDTGQVIFPDDHPDTASGPISNLYATWTVGWRCETVNGTADCQTAQ